MQPQHIPSDSTAVSGVSGSGGAMTPNGEGGEVRAATEADGDDWGAKPTANNTASQGSNKIDDLDSLWYDRRAIGW
ncbi:unnamed protein product [Vitrella brassicaformis CCMP3155]|uniref:Uncharacterized protein n=1 Tax=Vitrella brassicaformis (strain CCMP3155) TaxID=1169540 RepID=A0A0G4EJW9_VITBC|nr:unnamed protein product [Vitrella brassicaformis CCMP3155]|eukprot:CEL96810.1 unnamed protein product [Vitrella brassicaformis CCMP3155]